MTLFTLIEVLISLWGINLSLHYLHLHTFLERFQYLGVVIVISTICYGIW